MSNGPFVLGRYESALSGNIHPVRVAEFTDQYRFNNNRRNAYAQGGVNDDKFVATNRKAGRGVIVTRIFRCITVQGGSQLQEGGYIDVPVFREDLWIAQRIGTTIRRGNLRFEVRSKIQEHYG